MSVGNQETIKDCSQNDPRPEVDASANRPVLFVDSDTETQRNHATVTDGNVDTESSMSNNISRKI